MAQKHKHRQTAAANPDRYAAGRTPRPGHCANRAPGGPTPT
jgi:hypothetical protein